MENEEEIVNSTNDTETTENASAEETQEVAPQDDVEGLKKTIATLEAQKEHWREKAQANKSKTETKTTSDLSGMDVFALTKANVDSDDIEEVTNWAKFKGVSVSEALKSQELNAILNVRKDMRVTAQASNTGAAKRQTGKLSDEALLNQARQGNIPESEEDMDRLVRLKTFGGRK